MDTNEDISVESLVVFPAFRLTVDIKNEETLQQLERLYKECSYIPLISQIWDRVMLDMVVMARNNKTCQAWLQQHRPEVWKGIQDTYRLEKHHGN